MIKKNKTLIFFILFIGTLLAIQFMQDEKTDWRYSFSLKDKIPFGSYVLFEIIDQFFPGQDIIVTEESFYTGYDSSNYAGSNHIIINHDFNPDITDTISAEQIRGPFADSLKIKQQINFNITDTTQINFSNPMLHSAKPYIFFGRQVSSYFTYFDTVKTKVLGTDLSGKINFIKTEYYGGEIFLHTEPLVFTNYNILKYKNLEYYGKLFSYLPVQRTVWNEYYKITNVEARSPLRYILNRKPLKWAYFTGLFAIIILFVFGVKRRQRIIPVYNPPINDSIAFIETIGRLYYQNRNHRNLLDKKIHYFLVYLHSKFLLRPDINDDKFIQKLSSKSGVNSDKVKHLIQIIRSIQQKDIISETELHTINTEIEKFKSLIADGISSK